MKGLGRTLLVVVVAGATAAAPSASMPSADDSGTIVFASNRALNLQWPDIFVVRPGGGSVRNLTRTEGVDEAGPAWSPNGRRIAFDSQLRVWPNGSNDIFVMNADGSNVVRLTTDPKIDVDPTWSPDGRQIAFESFRQQRSRIWIMNSDGGNQRPLTSGGNAEKPTWSPDGTRIAFSGEDAIEVVNVNGSGRRRILSGEVFALKWSPTGRIGFAREPPRGRGDAAVYSMRADGSGVRRLTKPGCEGDDLAWSPNGRSLVVTCDESLWVSRADGSHRRRLRLAATPDAVEHALSVGDLSWSRRGIAYAVTSEFNDSDIWAVGGDGLSAHRLASSSIDEFEPARSPNGRWVSYVGGPRNRGSELYLVDTRTRKVRRLTRNRVLDRSPAWSPDGSLIAFERAGDLFTMRRDGRTLRRLTRTRRRESEPTWAPDGRLAFTADRSIFVLTSGGQTEQLAPGECPAPDGRLIAFERADSIYLMSADGSGQHQLTGDPDNPDSSPTWSPDGRSVLFARGKYRHEIEDWSREIVLELFVVGVDGSGLTRLTRNTVVEDFDPSWQAR